jgi:hypothetical protein
MTNNHYLEAEKQKLPDHAKNIVSELKKLGYDSATYFIGPDNLPVITLGSTLEENNAVKICFYRSYGWQKPGTFRIKVNTTTTTRSHGFPLRIDGTYNYQLIAQRVKQLTDISREAQVKSA